MSMICVLGTSARIIAASDSRRLVKDDSTGALLGTFDDTCKLALAGPFLLAATGAILPDARAAWRTLALVPGESAGQRLDRLLTVLQAPTTGPAELVLMLGAFQYAGSRPDGAGVRVRFVPGTPSPEILMRSTVDQTIVCIACLRSFLFVAAEQIWYDEHSLSRPRRCRPCRAAKKALWQATAHTDHDTSTQK